MPWSARLSRPIGLRDGTKLETLADARSLVLNLPEGDQARNAWQKAGELLMDAAEQGGDIEAARRQVVMALFLQAGLKLE